MSEEGGIKDAASVSRTGSECDDDDDDNDYDDYYNNNDDVISSEEDADESNYGDENGSGDNLDNNNVKKLIHDLEYLEYECLTPEKVDEKLEKECSSLASKLIISASDAGLLLQASNWKTSEVLQKAKSLQEWTKILVLSGVQCAVPPPPLVPSSVKQECGVCFDTFSRLNLSWLPCNHAFCKDCWTNYIEHSVKAGMPVGVPCMAKGCNLYCPKNFTEQFMNDRPDFRKRFEDRYRSICVNSHYQLRFCTGADCSVVFYAALPKARRVECEKCHSSFCFLCGNNYHSPTDCDTIKKWLSKCRDDSETANYICAHTKSCPKCHICIEKNGGCNHITCWKCRHDFCWMCLNDWKNHGNSYYSCSKYKENPHIVEQSHQDQAREALKKYLFYFERWQNHHQSLMLEREAQIKIQKQIEEKVMRNEGTWIDWQYLLRAGELLAKCRLSLQNTYPLVYYSDSGADKELFEYQQAQLELEIEELSWKLEHAGTCQRGDIENQMDIAAKRRNTLLLHFLRD